MDMVEYTILDGEELIDSGIVSRAHLAFLMQTILRPGLTMVADALIASMTAIEEDELDEEMSETTH